MAAEVSAFLGFYPNYRIEDVMEMYSVTFFTLLAEGYRRYFREQRMLLNVISAPHMKQSDLRTLVRELNTLSKDPHDIFDFDGMNDYSGLTEVKRLLR